MNNDPRACVITRRLRAPARLLFECYSDPNHMKNWFGPGDYPLVACDMDFRVGGALKMAMRGPDGVLTPAFGGTYLAIEPYSKIAYTNGFLHESTEPMVVTVTFRELGEETELVIHTLFSSVAQAERHMGMGYEGGVGQGLNQLADYLSELAA
jgi:uncharacterized protein YndB with AHSA1/START domain